MDGMGPWMVLGVKKVPLGVVALYENMCIFLSLSLSCRFGPTYPGVWI